MIVPVIHIATIDSTNDEAKRCLAAGSITAPCAIVADAQTGGRGTRGRPWASPAGAGLYVSFVHPGPLDIAPSASSAITVAIGRSSAEAIEAVTGVPVHVKPVNDLYVDGCKLGGILTESVADAGRTRDLVIGVGINLATAERLVDGDVRTIALEDVMAPEAWARFDRADLLAHVLSGIASTLDSIASKLPR